MKTETNWRLEKKLAVVTGGSEGIGLATAQELLSLGAEVIIASRSPAKLKAAEQTIDSSRLTVVAADLSTPDGQRKLQSEIQTRGRLDILVNNLGHADRSAFLEMDDERAFAQLQMNLLSGLALTRALFPYLKLSRGSVINISSIAAQRSLPNRLWYGVAKAALDQATRALASEWGPAGIRVNAVAPWFTETPLTKSVLDQVEMKAKILALTPLQRVAVPSDIARAACFLAMPASSYITGVILPVDGGYLSQGGLG